MLRLLGFFTACLLCIACRPTATTDIERDNAPDWRTFRSVAANDDVIDFDPSYRPTPGRFTFADLKNERDASLATRLLGEVGSRIVYIDRHISRWKYYQADSASISILTLYSQPESWGSAFGICRAEKYEIAFADAGKIESVEVSHQFGVEGPIFQKGGFDWDARDRMCREVPGRHTPSYFPAHDVLVAQDLAILLSKAIHAAGQPGALPFEMTCKSYNGSCAPGLRQFLAELRLSDIDEISELDCRLDGPPHEDCFTVTVGEGRLGPFPKQLTIRGSTYMNQWRLDSVTVRESFTIE